MAETADIVIIGAGVIGAATAFELAKRGHRVLNLDRYAEAGHGSTSGSCAIVRVHYSTLDGTAFAYEGYHYWRDWTDYLGVADERGLAPFRRTGCLVLKTPANGQMERHKAPCDALDIPTRTGTRPRSAGACPHTTSAASRRRNARTIRASASRPAARSRAASSSRPPATSPTRRSRRTTCSAPPRRMAGGSASARRWPGS